MRTMKEDCDKVSLIRIKPEVTSFDITDTAPMRDLRNDNVPANKTERIVVESVEISGRRTTAKQRTTETDEAAEERQRTGRYLAIGVTLVMLFIAFYHTLLRHATVLAGLLAPAIIMLLYILWLFYFAKKKKTEVSTV